MSTRSRSAPPLEDDLRLPRPPGAIRRFWSRHPVLADVLLALLALLLTLTPASTFRESGGSPHPAGLPLVVLTVVACGLLLRRRQWPLTVFIASYVLAGAFLFAPTPIGSVLLLFTSYALAVYRSSRDAWLGFGIGIGSLAALAGGLTLTGVIDLSVALNSVVSELMLSLVGTLIGVNVGGRKRYVEAIIDRSRQLLRERDQQGRIAAAAERARIAREMHDIVSHSLTVIVALTEGASATPDVDRARAATAQAAQTARSALREMRSMLGVLRDDSGGDAPLLPADEDLVASAVESARGAGFPVTLRTATTRTASRALPWQVRFAVGRVVQEGLTNAMRHAPAATSIDVSVTVRDRDVRAEVRNDGVVEAPTAGGYGLRGLRERIALVGGTLTAGRVGAGTWQLIAEIPCADDEPDDVLTLDDGPADPAASPGALPPGGPSSPDSPSPAERP
ncbi:sensor histidine kinase [Microbacterium sp. PA5]|uniref:sensor histidine kinase n=1 Tax=Microbacterium sp. PA5 TaxID=3416654 RepID=UPI003CECA631